MDSSDADIELVDLLNDATAREMQVSVQYMLQHTLYHGKEPEKGEMSKGGKFVASHWPIFLPGNSLKKIAVTEMRHAEAVAERVSSLGAEPTTKIPSFKIGDTPREILEINKEQEEKAIELYKRIIKLAGEKNDPTTESLFQRILSDEEVHHQTFSKLLHTEKNLHR